MKYGKYHINMISNDTYTESKNAFSNIGEGIQALAMDKIFSEIPIAEEDVTYLARDTDFSAHKIDDHVIMPVHIGVYGENKKRLPLPDEYTPVFTSMVIYHDFFDNSPELLAYFKKFEPVGCRDEQTKIILTKHGVKAYLMGCFTVCFSPREVSPKNGKVFFIDTPEQLKNYIPKEILKDSVFVSHSVPFEVYPVTVEEDFRQKEIACNRLETYKNKARLVVTGRLHAAIPCMAMGIPVILVREDFDFRFGWVEKYLPLYTLDDVDKIDWNPNTVDLSFAREKIISFLRKSLLQLPGAEDDLIALDEFYSDRKKTVLNRKIHEKVKDAVKKIGHEDFTYAVWGAGAHCRFVYDIIKELYPLAKPVVIVDKYVKGNMYGCDIITGDDLNKVSFEHMFITTLPGKQEAISKMQELLGDNATEKYTIITTTMRS